MSLTREITKVEKMLIGLLAALILGGAYFWLVYTPIKNRTAEVEAAIVEQEDMQLKLEAQQTSMRRMQAKVKEAKADTNDDTIAPEFDNLKHLTAMLNTVMATTEEYAINFTPLNEKNDSGNIVRRKGTVGFTCSNYGQAKGIINQLYDGPYRSLISDMVVESAVEGNNAKRSIVSGAVAVNMAIDHYEVKLQAK